MGHYSNDPECPLAEKQSLRRVDVADATEATADNTGGDSNAGVSQTIEVEDVIVESPPHSEDDRCGGSQYESEPTSEYGYSDDDGVYRSVAISICDWQRPSDDLTDKDKRDIARELKKYRCYPLFLTKKQIDDFYNGYSNGVLWPLFHELPYEPRPARDWKALVTLSMVRSASYCRHPQSHSHFPRHTVRVEPLYGVHG